MGLKIGLKTVLAEPPVADLMFEQDYTEEIQPTKNENPISASTEAFTGRSEDALNCGDECQPNRIVTQLQVTKKINAVDNSSAWTFYFNNFSFTCLNDFVNKMILVKPNDTVLIHAPSCLYTDDAEVIVSAIQACASRKISISAPYVLNSSAAYVAVAGEKIIASDVNYMIIDMPTVGAGGKPADAMNGMQSDLYRHEHILNHLVKCGMLTQEELKHIIEDQASVALFGDELTKRINNFNK